MRKASAREAEVDEAAAATTCWISCTSRVAGLVRMSFVNALYKISDIQSKGKIVPDFAQCLLLPIFPTLQRKVPLFLLNGLENYDVLDASLDANSYEFLNLVYSCKGITKNFESRNGRRRLLIEGIRLIYPVTRMDT